MANMTIFPNPKKMECMGEFCGKREFSLVRNDFPYDELEFALSKISFSDDGIPFSIIMDSDYEKEQYTLKLNNNAAEIVASASRGVFNALMSLVQIMREEKISCVVIDDMPDFADRAMMIDYSRGRIPKLETIKDTVDRLAELKYNQLQIAFDSIVFEYDGLEKYYEGTSIVTKEYVKELQDYCKKNMIDLVPNQNGFGHMQSWLALDDFKDLAECPDGFDFVDEFSSTLKCPPGTLNPYDPRSLELVDRIYGGLLPHFDSSLMNVCCDEANELKIGGGKSKEMISKLGKDKVYTDYMNKLNALCKKYDKRMMYWADMIIHSLDALKDMPEEAMPVLWGYEQEHPYEEQCARAKESGREFYVAPGTSSWGSVVGRSNNMRINQLSAAKNGKKYGARGYLLTDWGDTGHVQHPVISYLPIAYGAGLCWNVDGNEDIDSACHYLDKNMFMDEGFAKFLYDCGEAHRLEGYKRFNQTVLITTMNFKLEDAHLFYDQKEEYFHNIINHAEIRLKKLDSFKNCPQEHIEEIRLNLRILATIAKVCVIKMGGTWDKREIISEFEDENKEFKRLWLKKNTDFFSDVYINKAKALIEQLS